MAPRFARQVLTIVVTLLAGAQSGAAAECDLAHATYVEPSSGLVLQFIPVDQKLARVASTANMFRLTVADGTLTFHGDVIWNMGMWRPNGSVLIPDCAQPDNESPVESCAIWRGVVYALGRGGIITLPEEHEAAPAQILFTDFGRTMRYGIWDYQAWSGDIMADDVFVLEGCAP